MTTILVIEDEPLLQETILTLLELEGFQTISADNGHMGVTLAHSHVPDLILCDVMMPELDGYGVVSLLREDPITAKIPLIFLTAKATPADFRKGMNLGADDYLTKPFTQADLLGAIATRLAKQSAITQSYALALQQAEAKLDDHLNYDSITRLPTRLLLQERFTQLQCLNTPHVELADTSAQPLISIVTLQLDRFERFEESLEERDKNALIRAIAQRLSACVAPQDVLVRLEGGQFALILATADQKAVDDTCQKMLTSLLPVFQFSGQEIFLTASFGIAFYPLDGHELNDLMKKSSTAMHHAKVQGGNRCQSYHTVGKYRDFDDLALESDLRHALEREEFQVYYQPQVDLKSGSIVGAEALIRWHNPERGIVSPLEFIPLAEEIELIHSIGEWVLHTASLQTQAWQTAGYGPLRIAVNLSGKQFSQPDLSEKFACILQATGLAPSMLELELTESALLRNTSAASATLNALKALGIHVAIDDFGTGYASLSYLKQFSFDTLKIDRCFIRNVDSDHHNSAITTAVMQMASSLDLRVIAEGVETEAELRFLRQHKCDAVQGYFFSRPLPACEFEALLMTAKNTSLMPV